jgi:hypothetical protein
MARNTFSALCSNTSDANFRAWGLALSNALTGIGILKTSDTGQIDFTTVVRSGAAGGYAGYEIRQINDYLIKVEYGNSGSGATIPGLRFTVGTSSDGAGNLANTTDAFVIGSGTSLSVASTCYISGDLTRLSITLFPDNANASMGISFGQGKTDTGTDNTAGLNIVSSSGNQQLLPRLGDGSKFPATAFTRPICDAPSVGTGAYKSNKGIWPVKVFEGYSGNPDMGAIIYHPSDFPGTSIIDVTLWGTTFQFVPSQKTVTVNGHTGLAIAFRY